MRAASIPMTSCRGLPARRDHPGHRGIGREVATRTTVPRPCLEGVSRHQIQRLA